MKSSKKRNLPVLVDGGKASFGECAEQETTPKTSSVRRRIFGFEEKKLTGLLTPFWLLNPPNSAPAYLAAGYKRQFILTANLWLPAADFAKKRREGNSR